MAKKISVKMARSLARRESPSEDTPIETDAGSSPTSQEPKTSPYTSPCVTLEIGTPCRIYYVAPSLLQNPTWIKNTNVWGRAISLPDIDEDTGHVLVHYLYTDTYQTLDDTNTTSPEDGAKTEFGKAVRTYIMAKTHELSGLQQLAKDKIEHFGVEMNIFDIIEAVKEDFSKLSSDDTWFHEYLNEKVKDAWKKDHTVFLKNDVFGLIDDISLMRMLARCVVEIHTTELSSIYAELRDIDNVWSESCTKDASVQETSVQTIDETPPPNPEPEPELEPEPEPEPASAVDESRGSVMLSDKKKKSKRKGLVLESPPSPPTLEPESIVMEPDPPAVEPEPTPPIDDPWGFGMLSGKKKKGKKGKMMEPPPPSPPLEPEPEPQEEQENPLDGWGLNFSATKKKKSKKGILRSDSPPPPTVIPEFDPEVQPVSDPWDSFAGGSVGKKKKKGDDAGFEIVPEPQQLIVVDDEICPWRRQHLTEGDGWKDCDLCRIKLFQIAT